MRKPMEGGVWTRVAVVPDLAKPVRVIALERGAVMATVAWSSGGRVRVSMVK